MSAETTNFNEKMYQKIIEKYIEKWTKAFPQTYFLNTESTPPFYFYLKTILFLASVGRSSTAGPYPY